MSERSKRIHIYSGLDTSDSGAETTQQSRSFHVASRGLSSSVESGRRRNESLPLFRPGVGISSTLPYPSNRSRDVAAWVRALPTPGHRKSRRVITLQSGLDTSDTDSVPALLEVRRLRRVSTHHRSLLPLTRVAKLSSSSSVRLSESAPRAPQHVSEVKSPSASKISEDSQTSKTEIEHFKGQYSSPSIAGTAISMPLQVSESLARCQTHASPMSLTGHNVAAIGDINKTTSQSSVASEGKSLPSPGVQRAAQSLTRRLSIPESVTLDPGWVSGSNHRQPPVILFSKSPCCAGPTVEGVDVSACSETKLGETLSPDFDDSISISLPTVSEDEESVPSPIVEREAERVFKKISSLSRYLALDPDKEPQPSSAVCGIRRLQAPSGMSAKPNCSPAQQQEKEESLLRASKPADKARTPTTQSEYLRANKQVVEELLSSSSPDSQTKDRVPAIIHLSFKSPSAASSTLTAVDVSVHSGTKHRENLSPDSDVSIPVSLPTVNEEEGRASSPFVKRVAKRVFKKNTIPVCKSLELDPDIDYSGIICEPHQPAPSVIRLWSVPISQLSAVSSGSESSVSSHEAVARTLQNVAESSESDVSSLLLPGESRSRSRGQKRHRKQKILSTRQKMQLLSPFSRVLMQGQDLPPYVWWGVKPLRPRPSAEWRTTAELQLARLENDEEAVINMELQRQGQELGWPELNWNIRTRR